MNGPRPLAPGSPPSTRSAWLAGCGVLLALGVVCAALLGVVAWIALRSSGRCQDGDDAACARACFGAAHDEEACARHAERLVASGTPEALREADRAYARGCAEGDDDACRKRAARLDGGPVGAR